MDTVPAHRDSLRVSATELLDLQFWGLFSSASKSLAFKANALGLIRLLFGGISWFWIRSYLDLPAPLVWMTVPLLVLITCFSLIPSLHPWSGKSLEKLLPVLWGGEGRGSHRLPRD